MNIKKTQKTKHPFPPLSDEDVLTLIMLGKQSAELCTHPCLVFSHTRSCWFAIVVLSLVKFLSKTSLSHLWALLDQAKLGICV